MFSSTRRCQKEPSRKRQKQLAKQRKFFKGVDRKAGMKEEPEDATQVGVPSLDEDTMADVTVRWTTSSKGKTPLETDRLLANLFSPSDSYQELILEELEEETSQDEEEEECPPTPLAKDSLEVAAIRKIFSHPFVTKRKTNSKECNSEPTVRLDPSPFSSDDVVTRCDSASNWRLDHLELEVGRLKELVEQHARTIKQARKDVHELMVDYARVEKLPEVPVPTGSVLQKAVKFNSASRLDDDKRDTTTDPKKHHTY